MPYSPNIDYSRFRPDPRAQARAARKQREAAQLSQMAPVVGGAIGTVLGGIGGGLAAGIPTAGVGAIPGILAGAGIGGSLGKAGGDAFAAYETGQPKYTEGQDEEYMRAAERMALREAIQGLRGF